MFFHRVELSDGQLMEASERHGGCWEAAEIDPPKVSPEITCILTMEHQSTARDCVDAVYGTL